MQQRRLTLAFLQWEPLVLVDLAVNGNQYTLSASLGRLLMQVDWLQLHSARGADAQVHYVDAPLPLPLTHVIP
ncbi:hypothetical protein F5Y07DRAFT_370110 [Xylaria sp. FL0933]|nr:hypothetical protein F5Y07DRAFT_370110 [Xylaria sp. FL0933]